MNEELSPLIKSYKKSKEPFKKSEEMERDAQKTKEQDELRSGKTTPVSKHITKWRGDINEELLREDHSRFS